jgi:hypothetical protein
VGGSDGEKVLCGGNGLGGKEGAEVCAFTGHGESHLVALDD